ncbi:MAG: phytanoyl-CoA dioxygenase family protein, partial [Caldilineaceae bacterium SB0670_bin_27]|nr:phytanoyl-CoA dioxygenase family protein [Caldilineaceae bacterium SB0670_bin_27]
GIDGRSSIPHEQQICGDAGDGILIDSRIWHSAGANSTDDIRTSVVARYSPWWLSVDYGKRNCAFIPAHIFDKLPEPVQELYSHRRVKNEPHQIGSPSEQL